MLDCALDRVDDAVLVEAGTGDLGLRGVLVAGAAEQELIVLRALPVDAEDADVTGVVVPAGVDAARDVDEALADVELAVEAGEALRDRGGLGAASRR